MRFFFNWWLFVVPYFSFSYIATAELYYESTEEQLYTFFLDVYIECGGANDLSKIPLQKVYAHSESKEISRFEIQLSKVGTAEVPLYCVSYSNLCKRGDYRGLKKVSYQGTYDFSKLPLAKDWAVSWIKNYRSRSLNTIDKSRDYPYYTELIFDNSAGSNSSTRVLNYPILKGCINEMNEYNFQLFDADNDRYETHFELSRMSRLSDIPLRSNYAVSSPLGTSLFFLDSIGLLRYHPIKAGESAIIDLVVTEKREGKVVAVSRTGIQVNSYDCRNDTPVLTGINGATELDTSICANSYLGEESFFLWAYDKETTPEELQIDVLGREDLIKTKVVGDSLKIYFDWFPNQSEVGIHHFFVKIIDNACPINKEIIKEFQIEILESPSFTLGEDFYFYCDEKVQLRPKDTFEISSYTWMNWFRENDSSQLVVDTIPVSSPSLELSHPQNVVLLTENTLGCKYSDSIRVSPSIYGELEVLNWCYGDTSEFKINVSTQFDSIKNCIWRFGDKETWSSLDTIVKYSFQEEGFYEVEVISEDSRGCRDTSALDVQLCSAPNYNFVVEDNCNNTVKIRDLTDYEGCGGLDTVMLSKGTYDIIDWDDNLIKFNAKPDFGQFEGVYKLNIHAFLNSGCKIDSVYSIDLIKSPTVALMSSGRRLADFPYRCNDPDTVLRASVLDKGHGGLIMEWGISTPDLYHQINDSVVSTSSKGRYEVTLMDTMNCRSIYTVLISDRVSAQFKYKKPCVSSDSIFFFNSSVSGLSTIDSVHWQFGDNESSIDYSPNHFFSTAGNYPVTLYVQDEFDCQNSITKTVLFDYPTTDSISISSYLQDKIVCAEIDTVEVKLPFFPNADTILWRIGDNSMLYTKDLSGDQAINKGFERTVIFPKPGNYNISASVFYNHQPNVSIGKACEHNFYGTPILIRPELKVDVEVGRMCTGDSAMFDVKLESSGGDIKNVNWNVYQKKDSVSYREMRGKHATIVFNKLEDYYYTVDISDTEGCDVLHSSATDNQFIEVEQLPKPYIEVLDSSCANEFSKFELKVDDIGTIESWYAYDHLNERLMTSSLSDTTTHFLYNPGETGRNSIQKGLFSYSFGHAGEIPISIYMVGAVGQVSECRSRLDTTIIVDSLPLMAIQTDESCAKDEYTSLVSKSIAPFGDSIHSYQWFGDEGLFSNDSAVNYLYHEGGVKKVNLVVNGKKCSDTLLSEIYVKYKPKADFIFDEKGVEANIPIQFIDRSFSASSIDTSYYEFGDRNFTEHFDPVHIYEEVDSFDVRHIVVTDEGCRDTVVRCADLHTYLDLPTAFTPNYDGKNDYLSLIHKSIKTLESFKIFNRWGQMVFDAEGDVNAKWDGTVNGQPQEGGAYVVIVGGVGAYDTQFQFRKNVTLIR